MGIEEPVQRRGVRMYRLPGEPVLQAARMRTAPKKPSVPWRWGARPEESSGVDERRGERSRGYQLEIGMIFKKFSDDHLVFLRGDGADAVDEAAARTDVLRGPCEEEILELHASVEIGRGDPPADLGVSPEGAEPRTGGVQEDPVEGLPEGLNRCGGVSRPRLHDRHPQASRLLAEHPELVPNGDRRP